MLPRILDQRLYLLAVEDDTLYVILRILGICFYFG